MLNFQHLSPEDGAISLPVPSIDIPEIIELARKSIQEMDFDSAHTYFTFARERALAEYPDTDDRHLTVIEPYAAFAIITKRLDVALELQLHEHRICVHSFGAQSTEAARLSCLCLSLFAERAAGEEALSFARCLPRDFSAPTSTELSGQHLIHVRVIEFLQALAHNDEIEIARSCAQLEQATRGSSEEAVVGALHQVQIAGVLSFANRNYPIAKRLFAFATAIISERTHSIGMELTSSTDLVHDFRMWSLRSQLAGGDVHGAIAQAREILKEGTLPAAHRRQVVHFLAGRLKSIGTSGAIEEILRDQVAFAQQQEGVQSVDAAIDLLTLSSCLVAHCHFVEALEWCEKAEKIFAQNDCQGEPLVQLCHLKASCYMQLSQTEKALALLEQGALLSSTLPNSLDGLLVRIDWSAALRTLGHHHDAQSILLEVFERFHHHGFVHNRESEIIRIWAMMGQAYLFSDRGAHERGIAVLDQAIERDGAIDGEPCPPLFTNLCLAKAILLSRADRTKEAWETLSEGLEHVSTKGDRSSSLYVRLATERLRLAAALDHEDVEAFREELCALVKTVNHQNDFHWSSE